MRKSLFLASLVLAACTGNETLDTPRSDLPDELAGEWFTGTLSSIQYYDRDTGEWQNPSGSGFYWVLSPDGDYETGAVIDSTVGGCTMRLLGVEVGTVTVDGDHLTVYRHEVTTRVTNSCGGGGERTQGAATYRVGWEVERDDSGLAWLRFEHDDGSEEAFHEWE